LPLYKNTNCHCSGSRGIKAKKRRKTGDREEEVAAEQSVFFLRIPALSLSDRAEMFTATFRHVAFYSRQLDQRLVVYKLVVLIENMVASIVSFSQTLLSLILLYSKNRLFLMICML